MRVVTHHGVLCCSLLLLLVVGVTLGQRPPPNYSPDALPDTSFSCRGRVPGGYYADVEAGCQMFHVCGASEGPSFRFLCPNNTVFDQQNLICANWFQVVCEYAAVQHARNFEIFKTTSDQDISFNTLQEEDLPSLDDYDYDVSLRSDRFFGNTRASVSRTAANDKPLQQLDQFVAASTVRPFVSRTPVTPGFHRGSTLIQRGTTEATRFNSQSNTLDKDTSKHSSPPKRPAETRRRVPSSSESVASSPSKFGSVGSFSSQGTSATVSVSDRVVPTSASSVGQISQQRTSSRIASSSPPAERQSSRRASGRVASVSTPATNQSSERSRTFQATSSRATPGRVSGLVDDAAPTVPVPSAAPVAAALTSKGSPASKSVLSDTKGSASDTGRAAPPTSVSASSTSSPSTTTFVSAPRRRFRPAERRPVEDKTEVPSTDSVGTFQFTTSRPFTTSTPPQENTTPHSAVLVTSSAPFETETETTTETKTENETVSTISPVARSFFGSDVLPGNTARPALGLGRRGKVTEQKTTSAARGRSQAQSDSEDVAVTTFRPRRPITSTPRTVADGDAGARGIAMSVVDGQTDVAAGTGGSKGQDSRTGALSGRRRGSPRRSGAAARRGSAGASLVRPRTSVAPPVSTSPATAYATNGTSLSRPRAASGRRGRGGRRFNPAVPGGALKPVQQWRKKVARIRTTEQNVQLNSVGVDRPQLQRGLDAKQSTGDAKGGSGSASLPGALRSPTAATGRQVNSVSSTGERLPSGVLQTTKAPPVTPAPSPAASVRPVTARGSSQTISESLASASRAPSVTTTEASASTPLVIRRRIRVRGRPSRRPATSARPPPALVLPTNKEASPGGRLLRRPKLPLSSALPVVGRGRRLQQDSGAREARSGGTELVAPPSGRFGRQPAAGATVAPATDRRRDAGSRGTTDYDYDYYDDESDVVFRRLAEANELLLDSLTRARKLN